MLKLYQDAFARVSRIISSILPSDIFRIISNRSALYYAMRWKNRIQLLRIHYHSFCLRYQASISQPEDSSFTILPLSICMREPLKTTRQLLVKNHRFLQRVEQRRNEDQSRLSMLGFVQAIEIPQAPDLISLYEQDSRAQIFASFHFSDFVYALHKLLSAQQLTGASKVLSQESYTPCLRRNLHRAFGGLAAGDESQFLTHSENSQLLSSFLRTPHSRLLTFVDLPAEYGELVEVEFLGRPAFFPKGCATLALANRVPILPTICYQDDKSLKVELGKQIQPIRYKGESLSTAVQRITQDLVRFFEYFFLQYPQQWRYLGHLPSYFANCDKDEANLRASSYLAKGHQ